MNTKQKVLLIVGILGLAFGGFVLTKYLTRNVRKIRGGTVTLQTFDTPPNEEPLTE